MIVALAAPTLESIINGIIKLDPDASSRLETMDGALFKFVLSDLKLSFFLKIDQDYIAIKDESFLNESSSSTSSTQIIEAELTGTSSAFFNLALAEKGSDALFKGDVRFNGNIGSAQRLQGFFESLNIDWEEILAQHTTDFFAYQAFKQGRKAQTWLGEQLNITKTNLSEYLKFEARVTPASIELENFYDEVAELEANVERLSQKITRLEMRRAADKESE